MNKMKSIQVFSAVLPTIAALEEIFNSAEGLLFQTLTESQWSKLGLNPDQQLVKLENGYRIDFIYCAKEIPKPEITEELNLLIDNLDYEPRQEEVDALHESIVSDFCARVIPKKVKFSAFYHTKKETLIFDCKESLSQMGLSLLLKAIGSIETKTLHCSGISNSLTTNMLDQLNDEDTDIVKFAGFATGDLLVLANKEKDVVRFKGDYPTEQVSELLCDGYEIKQLNLSKDGISFSIDDKFKIKSIKTSFDLDAFNFDKFNFNFFFLYYSNFHDYHPFDYLVVSPKKPT